LFPLSDVNDARRSARPFVCLDRIKTDLNRDFAAIFTKAVQIAACAYGSRGRILKATLPVIGMRRAVALRNKNLDALFK